MPSVSSKVLNAIVVDAVSRDIDLRDLLDGLPVTIKDLRSPDLRVECEVGFRLMERAQELSSDPHFGLHYGRQFRPDLVGILGHVLLCAKDLHTAFEALCRFQYLIGEGIRLHMKSGPVKTVFEVDVHPELRTTPPRATIEAMIASAHAGCEYLTCTEIVPELVELAFPLVKPRAAYERAFRTTAIVFGGSRNRITYPREVMARKIIAADDTLFNCLSEQAEKRLAVLGISHKGLSQRLYRMFTSDPDGGRHDMESVSRTLCVSSRTLQRRLEEEGTSFQQILDEARADIARLHLRERRTPISGISSLLGFSDDRGFRRAFRKWTGLSPAQYRKLHALPDGNGLDPDEA